jgi:Tyrosyl-DNA phosphodiesterase
MSPLESQMNSDGFSWESLLCTPPKGSSLKAALFTTYDRADERLLAEHLLPSLLNLNHEPECEGVEHQYFLVELDRRLKQLHDKLVVVSSAAREEPEDPQVDRGGAYKWIWPSIRPQTVGSRRKAVQHSKLWLLHWGAPDEGGAEYLEIVVSSTNLTGAAFKGQLQAAWRGCFDLSRQRSAARLGRWGVLPDFLLELARSAGDDARLSPFVELLARAECPEGLTFVASVPGTHSRQALRRTPWGAAGLGKIAPSGRGTVSVSILSPFIGAWNADALSRWCAAFEGSPARLKLVWIDKDHPWARRWLLPESTWNTLTGACATLLHLPKREGGKRAGLFHEEQRPADDRWSHAKVYSLKRGNSRRLLVTSANFTPSAWGREGRNGELTIENFELGVCVEHGVWPFEALKVFEDGKSAATVSKLPSCGTALIAWAQAVWDGKKVRVDCRCNAGRGLAGEINSGGEWFPIAKWTVGTDGCLRSARVSWSNAEGCPLLVRLTCEHETMIEPVFDERPAGNRKDTLPPGVDEDAAQAMRDELLFEQYGGRVATEDDGPETPPDGPETPPDPKTKNPGRRDNFAVPAFVLARQHFQVVDNWADRMQRATECATGEFERRFRRRDGELLGGAFQRQAEHDMKKEPGTEIGARLAAEEIGLRLKEFPEE